MNVKSLDKRQMLGTICHCLFFALVFFFLLPFLEVSAEGARCAFFYLVIFISVFSSLDFSLERNQSIRVF